MPVTLLPGFLFNSKHRNLGTSNCKSINRKSNIDEPNVRIYETSGETGQAAADFVEQKLKETIQQKGSANLILATGASQFGFLEALKKKTIEWDKITVFHLDEYKGLSDQHPASFRKYLRERILDIVKPGKVYLINGDAENLAAGKIADRI